MCGILGTVNIEVDNLLLDQIKHRGPDYGKIEKYYIGDDSIYFGHRRLSIIDLSEFGNQPMNSACNNYSIIFNGEIYNHNELRKD
jgi:Asparagine synthase (glutamine-hydrolyzing)